MTKPDEYQPAEAGEDYADARTLLDKLANQRPTMPGSADADDRVEPSHDESCITFDTAWRSNSTLIFDPGEVGQQIRLLAAWDDEGSSHLSSEETTRLEKLRWLAEQSASKPALLGTAPMREQLNLLRLRCPGFIAVTDLVDRAIALSIMTSAPLCLPPLLLLGPPGVGKTHYSKALAAVLGVPVHAWSCATNSDAMQLITGHPTSWRGARMGLLTEALVASSSASPVFLLDEIDKFVTHRDEQPYNILLNILEAENAEALLDEYLRVRFDVSQAFVIATANDLSILPEFIRDRLLVIEIVPPKGDELIAVTRQIVAKIIEPLAPAVAMPGDAILARLARGNPRGIARIVRLALGFAAAEGRETLSFADVDTARVLAASEPTRVPMGFVTPMRQVEANCAREREHRNGRSRPKERAS